MAVNVYDTANQLESEIQQTPQFVALQGAFAAMKQDAMAYSLFQQFQQVQMDLQQKQMTGQELTDEDINNAQDLAQKVSKIEVINNLMDKEKDMSQVMQEINQIISKPIAELYQGK